MKKILKILMVLLSVFLTFGACEDDESSGDNDNNSPAFTLNGSYWGKVAISETEYDMCLEAKSDSIIFRSPYTAETYTNIKYTLAEDKTWSFAAYADNDTEQTGTAISTGTFADKTCTAVIGSLNVTTGTLIPGEDYDDRWKDCTLSDFFGLYEGAITNALLGNTGYKLDSVDFVFYFSKDSAFYYTPALAGATATVDGRYSSMMGSDVFLKYTFDSTEKIWTWTVYVKFGPTEMALYTSTFVAEGAVKTTKAEGSQLYSPSTDTLSLGAGTYQGEYDMNNANCGTYWGTVDYNGSINNICLVVGLDDSKNALVLSVKGDVFADNYTPDQVTDSGKTLTYTTSATDGSGDTGTKEYICGPWSFIVENDSNTVLSGAFSVNNLKRTVVLTFADGITSNTLTLGEDYKGEYDPE